MHTVEWTQLSSNGALVKELSSIFGEHVLPPPPASTVGNTPLSTSACPLDGDDKIAVKEQ
jgi:hypothetical protein